jgi:hypothetical protein
MPEMDICTLNPRAYDAMTAVEVWETTIKASGNRW